MHALQPLSVHTHFTRGCHAVPVMKCTCATPDTNQTWPQILKKAETAPRCKAYAFQIDDGRFWDPTDSAGNVSSRPGAVPPVCHTLCIGPCLDPHNKSMRTLRLQCWCMYALKSLQRPRHVSMGCSSICAHSGSLVMSTALVLCICGTTTSSICSAACCLQR